MRNDKPDALDQAVDQALAQYSNAEPLTGLEQRVMNRVRAEGRRRRLGLWGWAIAAGAAAVLVAGTLAWRISSAPIPMIAFHPRTHAATPSPVKLRVMQPHVMARRAVRLSREERVLLALASVVPEAFVEKDPPPPASISPVPISIEEIKIEPLRSDDDK